MLKRVQKFLWWLPFGKVPEIDATELERALAATEPPRLLDVRTRGEWEGSRIPGARNLGVRSLRRRLPAWPFRVPLTESKLPSRSTRRAALILP